MELRGFDTGMFEQAAPVFFPLHLGKRRQVTW